MEHKDITVSRLLAILQDAVKENPDMVVVVDDAGYLRGLRDDVDVGVDTINSNGGHPHKFFFIQAAGNYHGLVDVSSNGELVLTPDDESP